MVTLFTNLKEKELWIGLFCGQFGKVILRYKRIGYNLDVMHAKGLTQLHAGKPCIRLYDCTTSSYSYLLVGAAVFCPLIGSPGFN